MLQLSDMFGVQGLFLNVDACAQVVYTVPVIVYCTKIGNMITFSFTQAEQ